MNFQLYFGYLLLISNLHWTAAQKVNYIIGGQRINIEQCPYIVSILTFGTHHCGGTLLRSQWIITAAHCTFIGTVIIPVEVYRIAAGTSEITSETINNFNTKKVMEVYVNPGYDNNYRNDIALLKVKEAFTFSKKIKAASLLTTSLEFHEMNPDLGEVAGWGSTIPQDPYKSSLQKSRGTLRRLLSRVSVPIHSTKHCTAFFMSQHMRMEPTSVLCSGGIQNEDACQGDSGGPLMFKHYLVGIVSWGVGCGIEGYPGVYTRVDYFLPWVNDTFDGRNIPTAVESGAVSSSFRFLWSLHTLIFLFTLIGIS